MKQISNQVQNVQIRGKFGLKKLCLVETLKTVNYPRNLNLSKKMYLRFESPLPLGVPASPLFSEDSPKPAKL